MRALSGGIDFGTSNSTAGFMENGQPRLIELERGEVTMPSAVFFNFEDNRTYFGRSAISCYTENAEGRLLRALKSVLGSSLIHEKTRIKAHSIAFSDIIGSFLHFLKDSLETNLGGPVDNIVLGRPVQFVDDNPEADRRAQDELEKAAQRRGFKHIEFQFEPIAAALDYEQQVSGEELALIVDIGGGTSDFSVVRVSSERAKQADRKDDILASHGVHIGGTDFDRLLSIAHLMPELGYRTLTKDGKRQLPAGYYIDLATWQRIHMLYTNKAMTDLRQIRYEAAQPELVERMIDVVSNRQGHAAVAEVERAKIALTDLTESAIELPLTEEKLHLPVTRDELNDAIRVTVERVQKAVSETLVNAGIGPERITALFLTGGSSAIPLLRESVLGMLPAASVVEGDMFGSVGRGLALDAGRRFGA
ncbi:Hsp70 family protein [Nitratireductor aquimarinus]|uniref:Hsp70 family protein n=1 Tax=Alphaproteobacteria TaxID=28211 RepID=UPI0019D337E3|nr:MULTISPECIES: Hsp70 family protein [Alphaproteobacteria]MBN7755384.1 Hsp70 family protein [Nitratireductor aquimarinus]MBY5998139.1 Hsp70 family protein [Tritonibacter mobilis]MBY6020166.1 Hsp70 family protein [Nitratireductor sp. DP7N14-4]MCV0352129.1 Hsp70 family protein [Nitratireductor sp.]